VGTTYGLLRAYTGVWSFYLAQLAQSFAESRKVTHDYSRVKRLAVIDAFVSNRLRTPDRTTHPAPFLVIWTPIDFKKRVGGSAPIIAKMAPARISVSTVDGYSFIAFDICNALIFSAF
jgi:hypothetical protein